MVVLTRSGGVTRIEMKVLPPFFDKLASGEKTFEYRLGDFACKPGDILVLREWDGLRYTGRVIEKKVTYVLQTKDVKFWPDADSEKYGHLVLGFR
jgi:hypothetical protein